MPTYSASIDIQALPAAVFATVADLTKHPEWAADPLQVTALTPGAVTVGSQYRSVAQGRAIEANIRVTEYQLPSRFAFAVTDFTENYEHQFTFQPRNGGTHVERRIRATLSPSQTLLFWLVFPLRKRPNTERAMENLKARCEQQK